MATFILGKKQSSNNADIQRVWENIERYVSRDEISTLIDEAVVDIKAKTDGKKAAFAWSGGKDSIALEVVCERAGITGCIHAVSSPLEYPSFTEWVSNNHPKGMEIFDANIGLDYVVKNPKMLFPDSSNAAKWFAMVQHRGQREYFKKHHLDILILGRRIQDGNFVGRGTNIYTDGKGITRFSPLSQWKHEHILACIHYFKNRNIPPIYGTPNGWVVGTGLWPARQFAKDEETAWRELLQIDRSLVETGARHFPTAKKVLDEE